MNKYSKNKRINKFSNTKLSDKYWRLLFMKVLDSMYNEEATWSQPNWQKYGISVADSRKIEQEFERFKNFQQKKLAESVIENTSI
jgi:hypothetical protein